MSEQSTAEATIVQAMNALIRLEVDRAVKEERERCARLVEEMIEPPGPCPDPDFGGHSKEEVARATARVCRRNVAAAIRNQEDPPVIR